MSRAPFVMPKADGAFSREAQVFDTTLGWRFMNPLFKAQYGVDSMPETAENVAAGFDVSRDDQDLFAWRSQQRAGAAIASGRFAPRDRPGQRPPPPADPLLIDRDEHPRPHTTLEALARLPTPFRATTARSPRAMHRA